MRVFLIFVFVVCAISLLADQKRRDSIRSKALELERTGLLKSREAKDRRMENLQTQPTKASAPRTRNPGLPENPSEAEEREYLSRRADTVAAASELEIARLREDVKAIDERLAEIDRDLVRLDARQWLFSR